MSPEHHRALIEINGVNEIVWQYCQGIQRDQRAQEWLRVAPAVLQTLRAMTETKRRALQFPILTPNTAIDVHVWAGMPGTRPDVSAQPYTISPELRTIYHAMLVFVRDLARHNRLHCQHLLSVSAELADRFAGWTVGDVCAIAQTAAVPLFIVRGGHEPLFWARLCALESLEPRLANIVHAGLLLNAHRSGREMVRNQVRYR